MVGISRAKHASTRIRLKGKIGPKGQVVVPKPFRDQLGLRPGDKVLFDSAGDHLVLTKEDPAELLDRLFGSFPSLKFPKKVDWHALYESQYEG